ncbi:MAG: hypothetical protein JO257_24735 [Deltaproteobacteria bacterium]|nr:hypothetical protein [Deltaproteobacteria bacterium]
MMRFVLCAVALAACGGDSKTPDASSSHDGAAATVQMVSCPATPAATVTTSGFMYSPQMVTINQGQVVKFMPAVDHNVAPGHNPTDSTIADPGLNVTFGATTCLMFTQTGMYGFHCVPHGFNGTVIVN